MKTTLQNKEIISFSLAGLGQNLIYNYSATFIMIFYTDVLGLAALSVGTLMLVARVWDAINDPMMGIIVDKTRTRWGKLRPYLLGVAIPMAVFTILTFTNVNLSTQSKLIYAYITYIGWGMVYTVSDVPYWGLSSAMSDDPHDRLRIMTLARILSNVGLAIAIVVPPLVLGMLADHPQRYGIVAAVISIIGAALFLLAFFNTKERVERPAEVSKLKDFLLLKENKPLLQLQSSRMLGAFRMILGAAGTYFAKYNLNNEGLFSLLGGTLILSMIFAMILTPYLRRFFSKKALYQGGLIIQAVAHVVLFIIGYSQIGLVLLLMFIVGFSMGLNDVIMYIMVNDSIDYLQAKTQRRFEGMIFSLHTFTTKLQTAIGLFVMGIILNMFGFIENVPQSDSSMFGIFMLLTLLPAVSSLLSLIPMIPYQEEKEQLQS
ncbi:MAG: MFS transporter [Erysipelothrix sp.]|nr:MFS transporter [Erysipelothrix sp.]